MRAAILILAVWAAGLGAAAQFGKMSVLFDQMAAAYPGRGDAALGLIVSVVGMVGLVFGTTAGLLVARIGPRRALVAALVLGAGASALQSVGLPYAALIASRVVEGVSHLAIVVVGPTIIAGLAAERFRGLAMSLWSSFFGVTYAALALLAPMLIAAGGTAALLLAHAGWMVALAAALAVLLPEDPPRQTGAFGNLLSYHAQIYASPRLAAPAMGFFCYTFLYVAMLTLLPPEVPETHRALAAVGMPLISIALSLTFGVWLLGRMSAVALVQAGYAATVPAFGLLWLGWGDGALMLLAGLWISATLGLVQAASFSAIPELVHTAQDRAWAAGAIAQLGNVGTTTGTPLLALVLARGGAGMLAFVALGACLLGIGLHALQARRRAVRGG